MAKRISVRAREPCEKRSAICFSGFSNFAELKTAGYTTLADNPEVSTAVDRIAALVGAMTIQLRRSTDKGDERVKNGLSRLIDINPNVYMTRGNWVHWIVRTMLLEGRGNAIVFPMTEGGYISRLLPIPAAQASLASDGAWDYRIGINGKLYAPDEVLHFVCNPSTYQPWRGTGYHVQLSTVANNLKQAAATEAGFMASKWKPSLIVKVDALSDSMSTEAGRRQILNDYMASSEAGEPWLVPGEQFSVEQVRPLSLADLALADFVKLDKQTVAAILGVPPFVLGVGDFKRDAWNNFISATIMPLAQIIEQELTKKLLYSEDLFFRFNPRSLYNYDLKDLAAIADDQFVRGIMDGNEVRDWLGLGPREGLDQLIVLENYIPREMIAQQKKLNSGGD